MKRKFSVFFIFLALTLFMSSLFFTVKAQAFALDVKDTVLSGKINSKSAILLDENSKTVIFSQNETDKMPIASMCKIMTLLLCFESMERGDFNETDFTRISENASSMGGSQVFLEANADYEIKELIKSIVIASANDSCVAMAEKIAGSEEQFVNLMNERAKELNMNNTCFVNCTGLPKAGQYSCAEDVAKMFSQLIKHPKYFEYSTIWMDKIEHPKDRFTEISNTNKLVHFYDGCDSGKTGYTAEAGHCLAASAKRGDMRLICVVISAPDSKTRFKEVSSMFNYGFANYVNKLVIDDKEPLNEEFAVFKGEKDVVKATPSKPLYLFGKRNEKRPIEVVVKHKEKLVAPIYKGDVLGEVCIYENGVLLTSCDVVSIEDVPCKSFFGALDNVIDNWSV